MTRPAPSSPVPPRRSGVVVPHRLKWHQRALASLAYVLIRSVSATLRYEWHIPTSVLERERTPAIFCIWHNRLALALILYEHYLRCRRQPRRMAAIVSASKDGAILARVLQHFGVQAVRGSSSRRGPQALLEMTTWAERGFDLSVTPDGPRGPRYQAQPGVIALAQLTGLPIVPCSCVARRKKCLQSWDQFQIPLPFSKVTFLMGEPMTVRRDADDAECERQRLELQERLVRLGEDVPSR